MKTTVTEFAIIVLLLACLTSFFMAFGIDKDKEEVIDYQAETIRVLSEEALLVSDIVENLKLNLRTVAYHQAVATLEHAYPLEYRSVIPADEWEAMLSEKTDEILTEATTIQLNPNFRLRPQVEANLE